MGIFDRFKKSEPEGKKEAVKKPVVRVVSKKTERPKTEKPKIEKAKSAKRIVKKEFSQAYKILKRPIVTEKSTSFEAQNRYAFEVENSANKSEVKRVVQDLYGVQVIKVNIIKVPGKTRRLGQHEGWHSGYKKALVTLAQGESIEIIAR